MRALRACLTISAGLLSATGCGGGTEPGDSTGLRITVTTTGPEPDPDGYRIILDGAAGGGIGVNGGATLPASPGQHTVDLGAVAGNCTLIGDHPRSATVAAGELTQLAFAVTCVPSGVNARYVGLGPPSFAMVFGEETMLKVVLLDSQLDLVPFASRRLFAWSSSAPEAVAVSDTGSIRVLPGAAAYQTVTIRATFDTLIGEIQVTTSPPGVALHVVPSEVTLTPGGRLTLQALVETSTGERFASYLVHFAIPDGNGAHLTEDGCANTDCTGAAPDRALLFADAPGATTITADGGGRHASVPITVRFVSFLSVTAGGGHSCGLTSDGALFCWGGGFAATPIAVQYPAGLAQIQAGFGQTCGLDASGLAVCWAPGSESVAVPVSSTVHFGQLALTSSFSCGLDGNAAAWCWGANGNGQLGDGTQTSSAAPVAVAGGHTFATIAVGGDHACAVTSAGAAYCWGMNFAGELGTPADPDPCAPYECSLVPVAVQGGHVFEEIVAGAYHTCALEPGGAAWCWGYSDKCGAGPGSDSSPPYTDVPVAVAGGHTFAHLIGGPDHTCGLTAAGAAYCWGSDPDGRTGQRPGTVPDIGLNGSPVVLSPALVQGGRTFSQLDAGGSHTCGMATDGVYCWGDNTSGQIGVYEGSTEQPVRVTGQP